MSAETPARQLPERIRKPPPPREAPTNDEAIQRQAALNRERPNKRQKTTAAPGEANRSHEEATRTQTRLNFARVSHLPSMLCTKHSWSAS